MPLLPKSPASPSVRSLFDEHDTLRAVIDSALEGRLGRVWVDDAHEPRLALLELGCYAVPAGAADHDEAAGVLASIVPPREVLLPPQQGWRDLLHEVFETRAVDRPMRTYSPHALDRIALGAMVRSVPVDVRVERMDDASARSLDHSLEPHALQVFETSEQFVESGVGFCAVVDERTASASTSYAISGGLVEVAVSTHPDYRGRGLAQATAARMLLHCLEHGLRPEWCASNPTSKGLALRLGYRPGPLCDSILVKTGTETA